MLPSNQRQMVCLNMFDLLLAIEVLVAQLTEQLVQLTMFSQGKAKQGVYLYNLLYDILSPTVFYTIVHPRARVTKRVCCKEEVKGAYYKDM